MSVNDVDRMFEKITQLEEKLDRIEQLLLTLLEDKYITEEEWARIAEADQMVKDKQYNKLIQVK